MPVVYEYVGAHGGNFPGDISSVETEEEFEDLKEEGYPIKYLRTDEPAATDKSDPSTREKLKEGASNTPDPKGGGDDDTEETGSGDDDESDLSDRLPDHHNSLRSLVTDVAEATGEDAPGDRDAETSRAFLLERPEATEAAL